MSGSGDDDGPSGDANDDAIDDANDDADDDAHDDASDDDLRDVVPVALARPRRHQPERRLSDYSFHKLLGRRVVLRVGGFDVAGEFRGADEDDVYLRGELRWFVYPMSSVTSLRVVDDQDDDDGDHADDHADDNSPSGLQSKRPSDAEIAAGKWDRKSTLGDEDSPRGGLPGDPDGDLGET